jgi:hypothetical protein
VKYFISLPSGLQNAPWHFFFFDFHPRKGTILLATPSWPHQLFLCSYLYSLLRSVATWPSRGSSSMLDAPTWYDNSDFSFYIANDRTVSSMGGCDCIRYCYRTCPPFNFYIFGSRIATLPQQEGDSHICIWSSSSVSQIHSAFVKR